MVRGSGDATRVDPRRELAHPRGIQIHDEAEIWILSTGASHLARDRQIHGEDEQVRGIVFEHFTAEHHDLRTLRRDAEGGAEGGVDRLGHAGDAYGIGAREPELKRAVVGGIGGEPIREPPEGQCGGRCERGLPGRCRAGPHEAGRGARRARLQTLRVSQTSRVQTGWSRRRRHDSNGIGSTDVMLAETSNSGA